VLELIGAEADERRWIARTNSGIGLKNARRWRKKPEVIALGTWTPCAASYVSPHTRHRASVRQEEQGMPVILTPAQCREARLALGWTMRDLWAKSKVSIGAISRLERGEKLKDRTLEDIKRAFEAAGIRFSREEPQANEG
jgi:hypothetical protein